MVLTLMVYFIVKWMIRKRMKEQGLFIPDQVKKSTQKLSLKWIFTQFAGVTVVLAEAEGTIHRQLTNVNQSVVTIIGILGSGCQKYYA